MLQPFAFAINSLSGAPVGSSILDPPQVHTVQHTSKFPSYLHPYVFTYHIDNLSVHFWTCHTKGSASAYNGTLQGQILEPLEIRLISSEHLLIRVHSDKNNIDLNDLLIYQLPGANLLDTLSSEDVGSFEVGAKGLLGVADDKIAVWRHAGPQDGDVIDLYIVSSDGKFGLPTTLKAGSSLSREHSIRCNGYLSDEPVYIDSNQVLAISTKSKVPSSIFLTRWSTQPDQGIRKVYDFNDPPSLSEGEEPKPQTSIGRSSFRKKRKNSCIFLRTMRSSLSATVFHLLHPHRSPSLTLTPEPEAGTYSTSTKERVR